MQSTRRPSLISLRAFEAAARLGRMSLAAEELCVTHGAISRSIRHLEEDLSVVFFSGPRNDLRLTEEGKALAAQIAPAFRQLDAAIGPFLDQDAGTIRVSCLGTFAMRWLIPRLKAFQDIAPQIEVRLSASDSPIDFEREQYDVVIRVDDHSLPSNIRTTELFPEFVGLVASPGFLRTYQVRRPEQLTGLPILRTRTRLHAWEHWATTYEIDASAAFKDFEHFYFILEAAAAGLGACIAPWSLVMEDVAAGRLQSPFGFVPSGQSYIVARRPEKRRKIERFCDWLVHEAKAMPMPPASLHAPGGSTVHRLRYELADPA